jgi:Tol biopolymer transport system component
VAYLSEAGGQQDVWVVPSAGGQPIRATNDAGTEQDLTWTRDGKGLTFSYTEAVSQIFVQPADSGPARQLTTGTKYSNDPQVSPDGQWVAYTSGQAGNDDIWIIAISGGTPRRLTTSDAHDNTPRWSPDGTRIAFVSNRGGENNIWVVAAQGGEPTQLTSLAGDEGDPVWSPDGKTIAFQAAFQSNNGDIWTVPSTGGEPTRLTRLESASAPRWSPDGRSLIFNGGKAGELQLYRLTLGGAPIQITHINGWSDVAAWSPNGRQIALPVYSGGGGDLALLNADGSGFRKLTNDAPWDVSPVWSPDGSRIAVVTKRAGNWDIALLDPASGEMRILTLPQNNDGSPVWTPDGRALLYNSADYSHKLVTVRVAELLKTP